MDGKQGLATALLTSGLWRRERNHCGLWGFGAKNYPEPTSLIGRYCEWKRQDAMVAQPGKTMPAVRESKLAVFVKGYRRHNCALRTLESVWNHLVTTPDRAAGSSRRDVEMARFAPCGVEFLYRYPYHLIWRAIMSLADDRQRPANGKCRCHGRTVPDCLSYSAQPDMNSGIDINSPPVVAACIQLASCSCRRDALRRHVMPSAAASAKSLPWRN